MNKKKEKTKVREGGISVPTKLGELLTGPVVPSVLPLLKHKEPRVSTICKEVSPYVDVGVMVQPGI
jgi:hypothetical protein